LKLGLAVSKSYKLQSSLLTEPQSTVVAVAVELEVEVQEVTSAR
jgi:hypothetical protein